MDAEQKTKFLAGGWKSRPLNNLLSLIQSGEVTIAELEASVANDKDTKCRERINDLKKKIKDQEESHWINVEKTGTIQAYREYLTLFGDSAVHADEARKFLENKDTEMWQDVKDNPSVETIKAYQDTFPNGLFKVECQRYADDLPWYETLKRNTKQGYLEYKEKYPGKHDKEIEERIEAIDDENDWQTACRNGSTEAYREYLRKHPNGLHRHEALDRIHNRSGRELFLDELHRDINAFSVIDITTNIENNVATWHDLLDVFDSRQVKAIREYQPPKQLPMVQDFDVLPRGYTEVYFWGTKGTGKTCAIGATIGYLRNIRRSLNPINCPGEPYLHQLANLFNMEENTCRLPPGTVTGNLPAMAFSFKDKRKADHRTMLIDVAGEVFAGIFKSAHGINLETDEQNAIDRLRNCLNDHYNSKIHFFIVEYGNDDLMNIDGYGEVSKSQVMQSLTQYFRAQRLFRRSSVSMNILVTKCDRIGDDDRMLAVKEYINNSGWSSVVNGINDASNEARCDNIGVKVFSIGTVFAQDLCIFRSEDAEKIVEEIEDSTHAYKDNIFSRIIDIFRQ